MLMEMRYYWDIQSTSGYKVEEVGRQGSNKEGTLSTQGPPQSNALRQQAMIATWIAYQIPPQPNSPSFSLHHFFRFLLLFSAFCRPSSPVADLNRSRSRSRCRCVRVRCCWPSRRGLRRRCAAVSEAILCAESQVLK